MAAGAPLTVSLRAGLVQVGWRRICRPSRWWSVSLIEFYTSAEHHATRRGTMGSMGTRVRLYLVTSLCCSIFLVVEPNHSF